MKAHNPLNKAGVSYTSPLANFYHHLTVLLRWFGTTFCLLFASTNLFTQTYTTTGNSNDWNDPLAWNCQGGGCKPTPGDKINGGAKVNINDSIYFAGSQLQTINGKITVANGATLVLGSGNLLIENNKNKGSLILDDGSILVDGGNIENRGIIELTSAYILSEGNFTSTESIAMDSACIEVSNGNFENNGGDLDGLSGNIKVDNGNIVNSGNWGTNIGYCASGSIPGNLPGSEDCDAVALNCECLRITCIIENPDIVPGINSILRSDSLIGAELTALNEGLDQNSLQGDIFILGPNDDVCVDIFINASSTQAVKDLLNNQYGITEADYEDGSTDAVITVFFPIESLKELNQHPLIIRFVRPTPVGRTNDNSTLPNQGDRAQESLFARLGFDLSGQGIKIGVLSDSYDNKNEASGDIVGGFLPGDPSVGSSNPTPVENLMDLPGGGSDEGRAMLQIVHSVAPQAELLFHTAFISPQSFADGIRRMRDSSCQVLVDDVTYISESFFGDGVVANAVGEVTASGVQYFTSAGNFSDRAYEATFSPTNGNKHDFSGTGDWLQELTLEPGEYLMVLQWQDDIYSSGDPAGAQIDLDFYLADVNGNPIYGFNRDNIGGDQVEVMPFSVISATATTTNLYIEQVSGNATGVPIKYIVFKAGGTNNGGFSGEYFSSGSTVVGHATRSEAMTVGAVRYTNTPTFGGTLETRSFSSSGAGTKPDFTATDGVNTTVTLAANTDFDNDGFPNFSGTSAAAPHAAGVAALLLESQSKFDTTIDVRDKLTSTAIDYGEPAERMGAGFITAFGALSSFVNPSPVITQLDISLLGPDPSAGGELTIEGEYLTDETIVFFRDSVLTPIDMTDTSITVIIPPYIGNPAIWIFNPALANGDGGSDTAFIDEPILTPVTIDAVSSSKNYGENIPSLAFTTDNVELNQDPVLFGLLEQAVSVTAPTSSDTSSVGNYPIVVTLDEGLLAQPLLELYEFSLGAGGLLNVEPLELIITPNPQTIMYGDALQPITYQYDFGQGLTIPNKAIIESLVAQDHQTSIADEIAVLSNLSLANLSLANLSLANKAFIASYRNLSLANLSLANGMEIIEVDARHFDSTATSNFEIGTDVIGNLSLANFLSLANNQAFFALPSDSTDGLPPPPTLNLSLANLSLSNLSLANNYQELEDAIENLSLANLSLANLSLANFLSLANLSLANFLSLANISLANLSLANGTYDFDLPMANFLSLANNDNTGVIAILDSLDIFAADSVVVPLAPVNLVTGLGVGPQKIVPAALFSNGFSKNFHVRYQPGDLTINPADLTVEVHDSSFIYGETPALRTTTTGLQF